MYLKERKIIVTGGPTREWIDPVRYISNASSGKMGIALADAAFEISPLTVLIHGPVCENLLAEKPYKCVAVDSTKKMLVAIENELDDSSVLIMAAAPADYAPVERSNIKIKKNSNRMIVNLKKTPDILKHVSRLKKERGLSSLHVTGFAAETHDAIDSALDKLRKKDLDLICLNEINKPGAGFGLDTNIVTLFSKAGERIQYPLLPKRELALRILERIESDISKK